jgi:phage FluMu protein Com
MPHIDCSRNMSRIAHMAIPAPLHLDAVGAMRSESCAGLRAMTTVIKIQCSASIRYWYHLIRAGMVYISVIIPRCDGINDIILRAARESGPEGFARECRRQQRYTKNE